jgi:hypothetical protein
MNSYAIIGIVAAAVVALVLFLRIIRGDQPATLAQLADIVAQLQSTVSDDSFAVFLLTPPGEPESPDTAVNLQYSIANGRPGLDWELLAPRNIADAEKFAAFARAQGHTVTELKPNKTRVLRVEDGDLVALGRDVATKLYALAPDAAVTLIAEGFEWRGGARRP